MSKYQPPPAPEVDLSPENLHRLMLGQPIGPHPYLPGKEDAVRRRMETIATNLRNFNDKECRIAVYPWHHFNGEPYSTLFCTYADDRAAERKYVGTHEERVTRHGIALLLSHSAPLAALQGADMSIRVADARDTSLSTFGPDGVEKFYEPPPPPYGWTPLVDRIRHVLRPFVHTLSREVALAPLPFRSRNHDPKHTGRVFDAVFPEE